MSRVVSDNQTLTFVPVELDETNTVSGSITSPTYGCDGSDSTNYATINLVTGSGATTYVYYSFDTSSIPEGAEINSVSCTAKVYISTTTTRYIRTRQIQLCSGTTAKGSSSNFSNSTSVINLSPGTWTWEELQNAKIRMYVVRGNSSTSSTSYYIRFYGCTLTVSYSINGTIYELTASSSVDGTTITPASEEVFQGGDITFTINTEDVSEIVVKDNNEDVTGYLTEHYVSASGETYSYPTAYTTSGSISGTRYQNAIGDGADAEASSGNDYCSLSGSSAYIEYSFGDLDVPAGATITSAICQVKGHLESTSNSQERAECQMYAGSTAKGAMQEFTSTSDRVLTFDDATWTAAELAEAKLRFTIGYYGGQVSGATFTVQYEMPGGESYYYEYTLTNVSADHVIVIEDAGAFVPPEENENYTYYPITISSINATTVPRNGTTRVQEGTAQTITISPTDPQLTLALDNGVDITSQLVGGTPSMTYEVNSVSGASYGFTLNNNDYYESTNQGVSSSVSVCRVNFDLEADALVTISYINYAEATYDYGIFGKVDTALGTSTSTDSSDIYLACSTSAYNTSSVQTVTYTMTAGEHYIDIKYYKDQYTDSNNDSLQFKISSIEATGAGGDYTYTISNVQEGHSLIFIFGEVDYYFVTSSSNAGARLYPDGQVVRLAEDDYKLVIVPDDPTAEVTLRDNNTDVTSSLVYESKTTDKGTVVNYTYQISSVTAAHNLIVTCSTDKLYIKISGTWTEVETVYVKTNDRWEEVDPEDVFSTTGKYRKMT